MKRVKNLRQAMENKEDLLDSLIEEVRGMADFAKNLVEGSVSDYVPVKVDKENKVLKESKIGLKFKILNI